MTENSNPNICRIFEDDYDAGEKAWVDGGRLPEELAKLDFENLWQLHPAELGQIKIMGKDITTPRYQQSYERPYYFAGKLHPSEPLPEDFRPFLTWANSLKYGNFNAVLVNHYRGGSDYIGPHADAEKQLIKDSPVFSISLGAERTFRIRDKGNKAIVKDIVMKPGSFIVMGGKFQSRYTHEVPKLTGRAAEKSGRRINITFRQFIS